LLKFFFNNKSYFTIFDQHKLRKN